MPSRRYYSSGGERKEAIILRRCIVILLLTQIPHTQFPTQSMGCYRVNKYKIVDDDLNRGPTRFQHCALPTKLIRKQLYYV